ncbi:MAG: hypothetical protein AAF789_03270 [Bacteroidota bacterium]
MKKTILFTCFSVLMLSTVFSQQLKITKYIERTHISPKIGTAIGFVNQYGWEYGAFYQEASILESTMSEERRSQLPRFYEREFYGAYFSAPLLYSGNLKLKMNVRTGVSNGENFVITPSLLSDYKVTRRITIGAGVGSRAFRPTLQGSISVRL